VGRGRWRGSRGVGGRRGGGEEREKREEGGGEGIVN